MPSSERSDTGREAAVVIDRTSGDDHEGQDAKAQLAATVRRAEVAGFEVIKAETDEDVAGDSPWDERAGLQAGLACAIAEGAVVVMREPSRGSRFRPEHGLVLFESIPNLEVLGRPMWSRRAGAWRDDALGAQMVRFLDLALAFEEKRGVVGRTQPVMDDIKNGLRETKSGKPPGRPTVELAPEHVAEARGLVAAGKSLAEARERVRELRGYYTVTDPEARRRRDVGKGTLGRALGLPGYERPAQNPDRPKTPNAPASASPSRKGSLVGQAESGWNTVPDVSGAARPSETSGRAGAVTDGGA